MDVATIITIALCIGAGWIVLRVFKGAENLAKKGLDKARGISAGDRALMQEEALLASENAKLEKAEETRKMREQFVSRRKAIERKLRLPTGSLFEGWALLIWAFFIGFLLVQLTSYLNNSQKQLDALIQTTQQTQQK